MKLRLLQSGFETYEGQMGVIFFTNGLSTADVKPIDAIRMAAVMQCEWEDGTSPSVAQSIIDHAHTPASIINAQEMNGDTALAAESRMANNLGKADRPETEPEAPGALYTEESLALIADEQGIKGLRAIADPMGVKGNSIKELIADILRASVKA